MGTEMQNIDIKDFTTVSSVEGYDHVVVSLFGGASAKMTVSLFRSVVSRGLAPSIDENGVWHVGDENTGVQAEAKTPEFRQGTLAVEWKYTYEDDGAWRTLIAYADTRPDYASLTEEQREAVRLKYSDLTPEEIAELQQPAADMIDVLQRTNDEVMDAEALRKVEEKDRTESEQSRKEAETAREEAEEQRSSDYGTLREEILAATENANDAADEIRNPPKIENGTWWVWDKEESRYVDTGNTAIGRSPKVKDNHWWVWDDAAFDYVDTGIVVDNYKLTEEIAYGAREKADEAMTWPRKPGTRWPSWKDWAMRTRPAS